MYGLVQIIFCCKWDVVEEEIDEIFLSWKLNKIMAESYFKMLSWADDTEAVLVWASYKGFFGQQYRKNLKKKTRDNNWALCCNLEVLFLMTDALPAVAILNPHFPKALQETLKLQTQESSIK